MVLGEAVGVDRMVTRMPQRPQHNRSACSFPCISWVVAAICCVCSLSILGCSSAEPSPAPVIAASGTPTAPPPMEAPQHFAPADSHSYVTTGPLVVEQQADVTAERDGRVTAVKAEIGDHVRRGQVLATLDDRSLQAAHAEKAAHLDSLRAQVQSWETEEKSNQADLRRADSMRAEKILDDEDWEHVQYKLSETTTQVARAKADEAAAAADLHAADVELDQCRIVAPFDGVVGRRSVHDAQGVRKGDALFWITAQGPLHVLFTVPESAMAAYSRGSRLELTTADYPHLQQPATVIRVSPVVDPASGSVEVIGSLEKPSPLLKPGMSMQVKLKPR
jgi:RND family efflux transporter MFP subunit